MDNLFKGVKKIFWILWKNVRPLCYAMSIPTKERDTMFTLTNPMKVMNERYVVTSLPCPACKETETVSISSAQLFAYNQGGYAQDVLKDYDAGTRERFISGMCNDCFCTMNNFAMFDGDEEGHCVDCDDYHAIDMPCEDE